VGAHRCLAQACVATGAFEQAERVVDRGLALGPDAGLLDLRGDALAGQGRSEDALATWSRAYELHAENLSPRYSRAFLLNAYTEAKVPFFWKAIRQADQWAQLDGWSPRPTDA
jgi:tetratricopeptide (TPR) repeat protein